MGPPTDPADPPSPFQGEGRGEGPASDPLPGPSSSWDYLAGLTPAYALIGGGELAALDPLDCSGWPDLLRPICGGFNWLLENVVEPIERWARWAWGEVSSLLWRMINWLGKCWEWVGEVVAYWSGWVRDRVGEYTDAVKNAVHGGITSLGDLVVGWVSWLSSSIQRWFGWVHDVIMGWVSWLWANIEPRLSELRTAILTPVTNLWNAFLRWREDYWDPFWGDWRTYVAAWSPVGALILSVLDVPLPGQPPKPGSLVGVIRDELIDPWTDWLREYTDRLCQSLGNLGQDIWTGIQHGAEWLATNVPPALEYAMRSMMDVANRLLGPIVSVFRRAIEGAFAGFSPITSDDAPKILERLLQASITTGAGLAAMTIGGELLHPLKTIGMGNVAAIIGDVINYRAISAVWLNEILDAGLARPLRMYFNAMHRTTLPVVGELAEMVARDKLPPDTFRQAMRLRGYPEEWIERLYGAAYTPERYFVLTRFAQSGVYDEKMFRRMLQNSGYTPETISDFLGLLRSLATEDLKGTAGPNLQRAYREGYLSREKLATQLAAMGWGQEFITRFLIDADLNRQLDMSADLVAVWREQYQKDLIDHDTFRNNILSLGLDPERSLAIVSLEMVKKAPTPYVAEPRPGTPAYLLPYGKLLEDEAQLAYNNGLIDEPALRQRLVELQMPNALVDATLILERRRLEVKPKPKIPKPQPYYETAEGRLRLDTIERLHYAELITDDQARSGLAAIAMPDTMIAAEMENLHARLVTKPRPRPPVVKLPYETEVGQAKVRLAREQYQRGTIDTNRLYQVLVDLQMPQDLARAIVDYEELTKTVPAPPPPAPPVPRYKTAAGQTQVRTLRFAGEHRLVNLSEYDAGLSQLQIPADERAALVESLRTWLQANPLEPPPVPVPTYRTDLGRIQLQSLKTQFRLELLDANQLYDELVRLEMPDELAFAVVDYEELLAAARALKATGLS